MYTSIILSFLFLRLDDFYLEGCETVLIDEVHISFVNEEAFEWTSLPL